MNAHKFIAEDFSAKLKAQLSLKKDALQDIARKKLDVEAELTRVRLEVRELNERHKEGGAPTDPAGTKVHLKVAEIVVRAKKGAAPNEEFKVFFSMNDGADQFFNSTQENPV